MSKLKLATVWLDGCSGCHMSLLDIDERLIEILEKFDVVYSPIVDHKVFPEEVDITLIEGAVSTEDDLEKILKIRKATKTLVAFGDCAVTANVPSMRNSFTLEEVFHRGYLETCHNNTIIPQKSIPLLRETALPIYQIVDVDVFLQGCPPSADLIYFVLTEMAEGRTPEIIEKARFG
jgi:NAD-reducing hydrogenase small subunit